jgi:hypothetical protein
MPAAWVHCWRLLLSEAKSLAFCTGKQAGSPMSHHRRDHKRIHRPTPARAFARNARSDVMRQHHLDSKLDRPRLFAFFALRQVDSKLSVGLIPRSRTQEDDGSAQRSGVG